MPQPIGADTIITRDNSPIAADMDGEIVMMSLERDNYYGLGETGSRIWNLLETPQSPQQLCAALTRVYQVDPATCQTDIQPFLEQLMQEKLIKLAA